MAESRKILIVDDNQEAAESLGECLKASGHAVCIANDGLTAIRVACELMPEIVILDIGMPDMDGYELAIRLRSEVGLTTSTLIAVTGYIQEGDRVSAREAGINHHFSKPLDLRKLTSLLGPFLPSSGDS